MARPTRWTHMGACHCGHPAQTITGRPPARIHRLAVEQAGDGAQHAVERDPARRAG